MIYITVLLITNNNFMDNKQFLRHLQSTFDACINIAKIKNEDYANSDNPFKNFEMSTQVGVAPARAILVRISDKISRISNLIDREASVKEERITDAIDDAINYLAILKAYLDK